MRFIKDFIRSFSSNTLYTLINITGLAVGFACFAFILFYLIDELSFDKYHNDYSNIYRLESNINISGKEQYVAKTSFAIGPTMLKEFPEIEYQARFRPIDNCYLSYKEKQFYEENLYYTDSSVFDIFTYKFKYGNPKYALKKPYSIVLTETFAKKYFGDENPIGKVINVNNQLNCKVTAIIEDIPGNTHMKFDGLVSIDSYKDVIGQKMFNDLSTIHFWAIRLFTYVKLKEGTNMQQVLDKFEPFHDKYILPVSKKLNGEYKLVTSRIEDIHLHNDAEWDLPKGNFKTILVFGSIAIFILVLAGINYMNLATARSAHKAKEVGIKKVLGANRKTLSINFFADSLILAIIAFVISLVLIELFLPGFNVLANKSLTFGIIDSYGTILILFTTTLLIGIFSGTYPAIFLSSFQPIKVLNGKLSQGTKGGTIRKLLIIFQFTISITLITATFIVLKQLQYTNEKDTGYEKENILILQAADTSFKKNYQSFENKLLSNPNILDVSTSSTLVGGSGYMDVFLVEGEEKMDQQLMTYLIVDFGYLEMFNINILQGRTFNEKNKTDQTQAVIINNTAANLLGWNEEALGKEIHRRSQTIEKFKVIGVTDDFNFTSLYDKIGPLLIFVEKEPGNIINIKVADQNQKEVLSYLQKLWHQYNNVDPFKYDYLVDLLDENYESDARLLNLILVFSSLSIFISLLGLFGLSSFITEKYAKDIGIRRLLGAHILSIVFLLSNGFIKLILIAFVVAIPITWFVMDNWLQNFAYRLDIELIWFIYTGLIVMIISLLTVIIQTVKTATSNPVKVLRSE